ncbi:ImmA/IrrE family metallo-endopeptidase [Bacillus nakamurai]|uniref:ImmA/IrrE family metallo-endopeptidase n=1 Tax=Bacillus nakamurai TaxID=1793963 RepID=UPI0022B2217C|nr:ImmA/IrrE family metallo-endopeptidase [Bacillus nakamurai]
MKDKLEHQANLFAAEIILSDIMIFEALPFIEGFTIEQIASYFRVPLFVADYKFSNYSHSLHSNNDFPVTKISAFV